MTTACRSGFFSCGNTLTVSDTASTATLWGEVTEGVTLNVSAEEKEFAQPVCQKAFSPDMEGLSLLEKIDFSFQRYGLHLHITFHIGWHLIIIFKIVTIVFSIS